MHGPGSWRDCKAWSEAGLKLSTSSNEACKVYDAAVTQYVGWYSSPEAFGGLDACVAALATSYPDFAMGRVLATTMELMSTGSSPSVIPTLAARLDDIQATLTDCNTALTKRESLYSKAAVQLGQGNMGAACQLWEDVLLDHPTDVLALKLAYDGYFFTGCQRELRDTVARVLPRWSSADPLFGYLHGMYAFGLLENRDFERAERFAKKGLELNSFDGWSAHALAHLYEMTGRHDDGLAFMAATEPQWTFSNCLSGHNYWHTTLYRIEKAEYEEALAIYDTKVAPRLVSGQILDIVDASSFLYRMQLEGVDVGRSRWRVVADQCRSHLGDHVTTFNDVHMLMACLGSQSPEDTDRMVTTFTEFCRCGLGKNAAVAKELGHPLIEAFLAYNRQEFSKAASILLPMRYDIILIGGSEAQRDLFNQMLLQCLLKSPEHIKHARSLLIERKALRENSPLTDRLIARSLLAHED